MLFVAFYCSDPNTKKPYISLIHKVFALNFGLFLKAPGAENGTLTYVFLICCSSMTSLRFAGFIFPSGTPAGTFFETHFLLGFYPFGNCFSRFTDANIVLFSEVPFLLPMNCQAESTLHHVDFYWLVQISL